MNATRPTLAEEAIRWERGQRRTVEFARWRNPRFVPGRFHKQLGAICDSLTASALDGGGAWVTLNAPPRHGKTELVGRCMGARAMSLRPGFSVLYATSTATRAEEVSARARHAVEQAQPNAPHLARGRTWTVCEWETEGQNAWVGVGVGNPTGGIGANLVVLDDITGSRERARSRAFQSRSREWIEEDVMTRLLPGGTLVVMETRRGEDDACGWLQQTYGARFGVHVWRCMAEPGDTDGRAPGEFLWPERYGPEWFAQASMLHSQGDDDEDDLTPAGRIWSSLYQQRPTAAEGTVLKRAWFTESDEPKRVVFYDDPPDTIAASASDIVISIDCAGKEGAKNDWTVMQVWARVGTLFYLLDELREKIDITVKVPRAVALIKRWPRASGFLIEDASDGTSLIRFLRQAGYTAVEFSPHGRDKEQRANRFIMAAESNRLRLPRPTSRNRWVEDVIDEWVTFGGGSGAAGSPDDRLDAAAQCIDRWSVAQLRTVRTNLGALR